MSVESIQNNKFITELQAETQCCAICYAEAVAMQKGISKLRETETEIFKSKGSRNTLIYPFFMPKTLALKHLKSFNILHICTYGIIACIYKFFFFFHE